MFIVIGIVGLLIVAVLRALAPYIVGLAIFFAGVLGLVAVGWVVYSVRTNLQRQRALAYIDLCEEYAKKGTLAPERLAKMESLGRSLPDDLPLRTFGEEGIYRNFVAQILADGHVDGEERRILGELEFRFAFDPLEAVAIKNSAFEGLLTALRGEFDEVLERRVREVAESLGLAPKDIENQLQPLIYWREQQRQQQRRQVAEQAERARVEAERQAEREREYRLAAEVWESGAREAVPQTVKLNKTETPWYVTPAVEIKRLKKGDTRRAGELLVTDRRLLFMADGTTTVRLNQILDVAADLDEGNIRVIKDGRKQPIDFEVPHPLVALAHVERSLAELAG